MISETLKKYIPSKDYAAYLEGIDHVFTDFEEAAILCHVIDDVSELHRELKKIGQRTKDVSLKEQIEEYLRPDHDGEMWACSNELFPNAYVDLPPMFDKGDFVGFAANSSCAEGWRDTVLVGIVNTSREDCISFRERIRVRNLHVDYGDMAITIQFLYEDGDFGHAHISPLHLERIEPDKDEAWYELARCGQGLIMGSAYIGYFTYCQQKYKEYLAWTK